MKHKLTKLDRATDNSILIVEEVNMSTSVIDKTTRQKNNYLRVKEK